MQFHKTSNPLGLSLEGIGAIIGVVTGVGAATIADTVAVAFGDGATTRVLGVVTRHVLRDHLVQTAWQF